MQLAQRREDNRSGCGAGVLTHHTKAVIASSVDSGLLGINFKIYSVIEDTLECAAIRSSSRLLASKQPDHQLSPRTALKARAVPYSAYYTSLFCSACASNSRNAGAIQSKQG